MDANSNPADADASSTSQAAGTPPPVPHVRRRMWVRVAIIGLCCVAVLFILLPYAFNIPAVRAAIVKVATADLNGSVEVGSARLGWFSPVRVYDVVIQPDNGEPLLEIPAIEGDVALWRLLLNPLELGRFRVREPDVYLEFDESGPLFQRLFPPPPADEPPSPPPDLSGLATAFGIRIERAGVRWKGPQTPAPWEVDDINISIAVGRSPAADDGAPWLMVEPGVLLDHAGISPAMCEDTLKYIAPAFSGVTRAQGEFSIELDEWKLPLNRPREGHLGGRLSLHLVEVGPGPMVESILSTVGIMLARSDDPAAAEAIPRSMELARESVIDFEMRDERIHHHGFELHVAGMHVRTSGSVGIDHTMDVTAEIELPTFDLENRPLLSSLSGKKLVLPIGGTLDKPQIDASRMGESSLTALLGAVSGLLGNGETDDEQVGEQLDAAGLTGWEALLGGDGTLTAGELDLPVGDGQIIDWLRRRREGRDAASPNGAEDIQTPQPQATDDRSSSEDAEDTSDDPPRRGLFGGRLRDAFRGTPEPE